ncbi:procathepsin L-like [Engraulis encrasicolus]|uniref:procathepsin L-like n=1 Tax=Engraulis encrasicolus TaxID=184585 RepID=UPI002FCF898D
MPEVPEIPNLTLVGVFHLEMCGTVPMFKVDKVYNTPKKEARNKNTWLFNHHRANGKEYPDTQVQIHNITNQQERPKLPPTVDWRKKGCVTPVRSQHKSKCGSCWAFSAVGALESHVCIKHKYIPTLSVQQLLDCAKSSENHGCRGGSVDHAFEYVKHSHGIVTEKAYPYKAKTLKCRFQGKIPHKKVAARCLDYKQVPQGDERALQKAVALFGPVSVTLHTVHDTFENYKSGVYYDRRCVNTMENFNHAMLVVGYGTTKEGKDYWLVKNSYGLRWGEGGYIKMARNKKNHCGIATFAFYPIVA